MSVEIDRIEKRLGKIASARFGIGGYNDAMVGFTLEFSLGGSVSGVSAFQGFWVVAPTANTKWTVEQRNTKLGEIVLEIARLLSTIKGRDVHDLVGAPVEVTLVNNTFHDWRLLTEVM